MRQQENKVDIESHKEICEGEYQNQGLKDQINWKDIGVDGKNKETINNLFLKGNSGSLKATSRKNSLSNSKAGIILPSHRSFQGDMD